MAPLDICITEYLNHVIIIYYLEIQIFSYLIVPPLPCDIYASLSFTMLAG